PRHVIPEQAYARGRAAKTQLEADSAVADFSTSALRDQPAGQNDCQCANHLQDTRDGLRCRVQALSKGFEEGAQDGFRRDQLAGNPAEQRRTTPDENREAGQQGHDERRSSNDQGNAECQAKNYEIRMAAGCSRNREHIVQTHHEICNRDDANGLEQAGPALYAAFMAFLRREQLDGNPEQETAADQLQPLHLEKELNKNGEEDAQQDRNTGAQNDASHSLSRRERSARERDDNGVVTGEDDVDADDAQDVHDERSIEPEQLLNIAGELISDRGCRN